MLEVFRMRTAVGDGDSLRKFASEQEKPWHKTRFGISITVVVFHTNDQRRNTNMEFERPVDKSLATSGQVISSGTYSNANTR